MIGRIAAALALVACSSSPNERDAAPVTPISGRFPQPHLPSRVVDVGYEPQVNDYWCGPTATDMALSARITPPGQAALATELGTTTDGTDRIDLVTPVLNAHLGASWYTTREMPDDPPSSAQHDLLWADLVRSVDDGFALVANIVAPPDNHPPGYPDDETIYHYFTVIGYDSDTRSAYIADPADFAGNTEYWLTFDQLSTLIPPKGYTALATCARDAVTGDIATKYDALGGCSSPLGPPIDLPRDTADGGGQFSAFEQGTITWTAELGAHEVHGRIFEAWSATGGTSGRLGYPTSDEYADGDGLRSDFEHGFIHWSQVNDLTSIGP
jgi:hypothetical protein